MLDRDTVSNPTAQSDLDARITSLDDYELIISGPQKGHDWRQAINGAAAQMAGSVSQYRNAMQNHVLTATQSNPHRPTPEMMAERFDETVSAQDQRVQATLTSLRDASVGLLTSRRQGTSGTDELGSAVGALNDIFDNTEAGPLGTVQLAHIAAIVDDPKLYSHQHNQAYQRHFGAITGEIADVRRQLCMAFAGRAYTALQANNSRPANMGEQGANRPVFSAAAYIWAFGLHEDDATMQALGAFMDTGLDHARFERATADASSVE